MSTQQTTKQIPNKYKTIDDMIVQLTYLKSIYGNLPILFHTPEQGLNDYVDAYVETAKIYSPQNNTVCLPHGKICIITNEH